MRTTLTLDDDVARALRSLTEERGEPFKKVVNDLLRLGLEARLDPPAPRRVEIPPASLGRLKPGIDLDRALRLAGDLEDAEMARELELRK